MDKACTVMENAQDYRLNANGIVPHCRLLMRVNYPAGEAIKDIVSILQSSISFECKGVTCGNITKNVT